MLLKLGDPVVFGVLLPVGLMGSPARIILSKAGGAVGPQFLNRAVSLGAFTVGEPFAITLVAADTDTVGSLQVIVFDNLTSFVCPEQFQVVEYLPGEVQPSHRLLIAADTWGLVDGIESGLTPQNAMRVAFAVLAGKDSVVGPVVNFRNFGDTKTRVSATVDPASKTRLFVTYDFS